MKPTDDLSRFCEVVGFRPTVPQLQLLRWIVNGDRGPGPLELPEKTGCYAILAGRSSGKSTLASLAAVYIASRNEKVQVICCSQTAETTADVLFTLLRGFLIPIRAQVVHEGRKDLLRKGSTSRVFRLNNGSQIIAAPSSKSSTLRGYGPYFVVIDEAAAMPSKSEQGRSVKDILEVVVPRMTAQYGRPSVCMISTPSCVGSGFHQLVASGEYDITTVRIPTPDLRPDLPAEWFDRLRKRNPRLARIEIDGHWGESEASFVSGEALAQCFMPEVPPPDCPPILGIDLASPGGADYTGLAVVSRSGNEFYVHHCERRKFASIARAIDHIIKIRNDYPRARLIADQWSFATAQELFAQRNLAVEQLAWTGFNRQGALGFLASLIESGGQIRFPESAREVLTEELMSFSSGETKGGVVRTEHRRGGHDDMTFAILLAVERLRKRMPIGIACWGGLLDDLAHPVASIGSLAQTQ